MDRYFAGCDIFICIYLSVCLSVSVFGRINVFKKWSMCFNTQKIRVNIIVLHAVADVDNESIHWQLEQSNSHQHSGDRGVSEALWRQHGQATHTSSGQQQQQRQRQQQHRSDSGFQQDTANIIFRSTPWCKNLILYRLKDLTQGSVALVDTNIPPSTLGLLVKATPKPENEGIAFSQFTLTTPGRVSVVLQVVPSQPSRVQAFIRRDALPNSTDYDWSLSWNDTTNYTRYIAAELTKDVTHIYVGVQSIDGL